MDQSFLSQEFLGLPALEWIKLIGLWLAFTAVFFLARRLLFGRFSKLAERTKNQIDDVIAELLRQTKGFFLLIIGLYFSAEILTQDAPSVDIILRLVFLVLLFQIGIWASSLIEQWAKWFSEKDSEDGVSNVTAVKVLVMIGRLIVWSIIILMALDNLGVNITALVAGLGIGSLAVGLALKDVFQDILAYIAILVDKPFVYGDYVVVGDYSGTVEHIGIKTTRVRSLSGELIVFGNSDLLSSRLRNYKSLNERRGTFSVGVTYDTPYEKLAAIPERLKEIVEAEENARFDRGHLKAFGDSAITFEVVFYMLVPQYAEYMDTQQSINLAIHRYFASESIEFAFPTQTIHVESLPASNGGPTPIDTTAEAAA
ncbi:MAG: mechanosensitive ion channel family protein [Rhodothermia bacterium]|nr:MAG: mechanosensitive ion channel family protein [Rhodothermia bacterium]